MSVYQYTDNDSDTLTFAPNADQDGYVSVNAIQSGRGSAVCIPNEDAPTVAAELLKAAGQDVLAQLLADVLEQKEAAIKKAAEKKLQERRNALIRDLTDGFSEFDFTSEVTQKAIDHIIKLEDEAAE